MLNRFFRFGLSVFVLIAFFGFVPVSGFAMKRVPKVTGKKVQKTSNRNVSESHSGERLNVETLGEKSQQDSSLSLFSDLPVEMIVHVFSYLDKEDRNRMVRLGKGSREELVGAGLFSDPDGKSYRKDVGHLVRLGEQLERVGGARNESAWRKVWFKDPTLSKTDRHELFSGSSQDRQAGLYQLRTVAGIGERGDSGDGGPAIKAKFSWPRGFAVGADGRIVLADHYSHRLRLISKDGVIRTIAGIGERGISGDGGQATKARLYSPIGVAVGADGRIVFADHYNNRLRLISKDGVIRTIAGTGEAGFSGDGGLATKARINGPYGVAVGAGRIVLADHYNNRLREIGKDGVIRTIAGTGGKGFSGDGGPATEAQLNGPHGVAVGADGSVMFADTSNNRIRAIDPQGVIRTVAGTGGKGFSGDGGPAIEAQLSGPRSVAVGADGTMVISDSFNMRVRLVNKDGVIRTVAGTFSGGGFGDGWQATETLLRMPEDVAFGADGSILFADGMMNRLYALEGWFDVGSNDDSNKSDQVEAKAKGKAEVITTGNSSPGFLSNLLSVFKGNK